MSASTSALVQDLNESKSEGKLMIRSRGDFGNILGLMHDVMSFYENGPEYDMVKVLAKKDVMMKHWTTPVQIDGGFMLCGTKFRYPEDFPVDAQIPRTNTEDFWMKKEQENKKKLEEEEELKRLFQEIENCE
jgi:hypothetical protein